MTRPLNRPLTLEEIERLITGYKSIPPEISLSSDAKILSMLETARMLYALKEAASEYRSLTQGCLNNCNKKGCATFDLDEALRPFTGEPK